MAETSGYTSQPGAMATIAATGLPPGLDMGFQIRKAASGLVSIARIPAPEATPGAYVATFVAPAEPDLYLAIFDWNEGTLTPEESATYDFIVQGIATVEHTGFGSIADHARLSLGGEAWTGLMNSPSFGPDTIKLAVDAVKARTLADYEAAEDSLPKVVLSYLGKLVALELLPAARSWWGNQIIQQAVGDDPREVTTYANRDKMLDELESLLLRQVSREQPLALQLIPEPVLAMVDSGPEIDEDDNSHFVTDDPRTFPALGEFPVHDHVRSNRATWLRPL